MELYEKRTMGSKGQVVFPEEMREQMQVEEGSQIVFLSTVKDNGTYTVKLKVVDDD